MSYRGHSRNRNTFGGQNYNNNNNGHFPNNLQSKISQFNDQNKLWVEIQGWTNASLQDLVSFIARKSNIGLRDVEVHGDTLRASVTSEKDADYLKSFAGIRFAGNSLKITVVPKVGGVSGNTASIVDLFTSFLTRRFNVQERLLDLTYIAGDPYLNQQGLVSGGHVLPKMFTALMKLAAKEPIASGVDSLILAENNLAENVDATAISQTFPFLKNLSLASNNILRLRALDGFKNKLNSLRVLVMTGNPVVTDPAYKPEMLRLFPRLVMLDAHPVRDENKLMQICSFPLPRAQFFFEGLEIQSLVTNFISNYLNFWDNDRKQLIGLYTPDSQFSVSIDSGLPFLISDPNNSYQDKNNAPWGYYLPLSRNLTKISTPQVVQSRVARGPESISGLFRNIPGTRHVLTTNPEQFSTDSWKVTAQAVMIVLHGEFEEVLPPVEQKTASKSAHKSRYNKTSSGSTATALARRSFDRSWLVVSAGNSFVIASDLLVVRPYAGVDAWKPASAAGVPTSVATGAQSQSGAPVVGTIPATVSITSGSPLATATNITIPPEIAAKLTTQQQELLIRIILATKLNINFAGMLAEQSNWDLNAALQNFNASKANIPQDAYMKVP